MKHIVLLAAAAAFLPVMSSVAVAGPIERACMASDRGGNRSLCGCIQQAADMTLSGGDQRRAAKFFKDPEAAHATWTSQSKSTMPSGSATRASARPPKPIAPDNPHVRWADRPPCLVP
jgi:hypothetical protein